MPDFSQPPSPASDLGEPDDFPVGEHFSEIR